MGTKRAYPKYNIHRHTKSLWAFLIWTYYGRDINHFQTWSHLQELLSAGNAAIVLFYEYQKQATFYTLTNILSMYKMLLMEVIAMDEIKRLQKYLLLVRRTVGWSAEEFGERIGVTRQTINNIESGRNKLTKTQYIAMRSVLDAEIASYPDETEILRLILDVFVDNPEKYNGEDRERLLNQANMMTPSILAGATSRKDVSKALIAAASGMGILISAISPIAAAGIIGSSSWIAKILVKKMK